MKLPVDVFFNRIKDATFNLEDSEKIEFYEELLETGSATVSINNNLEFNFKIESFDWECIEVQTESITDNDLLEHQETIDDIDFIIGMDDDEIFDELDNQSDGEI